MIKLDIQKNGKPCIYSITNNENGKIYIGSAIGHYRRKGQHFYLLRRNKHWNKHLQSAFNKYGEEKIEFKVIEFIDDMQKLSEKESYWIKKINSTDNKIGYNTRIDCTTNLGKKWPMESRIKFSESKKGKIPPHLNYKEIAEKNMKKITAKEIGTNKEFKFDSIMDASMRLSVHKTSISKALHKKLNRAGAYYWNFTE